MHSVSSFAAKKGISVSRVRALAVSGEIPSERVGNLLIIPDAALAWRPRSRRPLSQRMSLSLLDAMTGVQPNLSPKEKSRLRAYLTWIANSQHPAEALSDLLADRGRRVMFSAHPDDLQDLKIDDRVMASGASIPDFGLSSGARFEAYVTPENLDSLVRDYMLRPDRSGNVGLRAHAARPEHRLPLAAADLAEMRGGRELREADRVAKHLAEKAL